MALLEEVMAAMEADLCNGKVYLLLVQSMILLSHVVCLSVTIFCIVTKRYVLANKLSEGANRKPGSKKVDFWVVVIFLLLVLTLR